MKKYIAPSSQLIEFSLDDSVFTESSGSGYENSGNEVEVPPGLLD